MRIIGLLDGRQKKIYYSIKKHAEILLGHQTKFFYFTLHGKNHINNMLNIADILFENGIELNKTEAFYLCIAICIHDLGMVVSLSDKTINEISGGLPQISDTTYVNNFIRDNHHGLIDNYIEKHFDFLSSLGLNPPEIGIIKDIAKSHRKIPLESLNGYQKKIGALLRTIDELDIGPERAPIEFLRENYKEMDSVSCWHWFKHNIVDPWEKNHNISVSTSERTKTINFKLIVRPPKANSLNYWKRQILRPIYKVLSDEKCGSIINYFWGINIYIDFYPELSTPNYLNHEWEEIEIKALSNNRKTILLIDDEVRKMEDLLYPLMSDFHIDFASNAKDALIKIEALKFDLAIVDLQIGSGDIWDSTITEDYKITGKIICEKIKEISPQTKIGILTGTRHDSDFCKNLDIVFYLQKPVDPEFFEEKINEILK